MQEEDRPQILIRSAKLEDAQHIAELSHLLGYPSSEQETHKRLQLLSNQQEHVVYVAHFLDEPVIGWVHVFVLKSLVVNSSALVGGLIVNPKYQGRGIGRLLIKCAEQWAKDQGCTTVRVNSNIMRQEAHRFYEKVGYSPFKTQLAFLKNLSELK